MLFTEVLKLQKSEKEQKKVPFRCLVLYFLTTLMEVECLDINVTSLLKMISIVTLRILTLFGFKWCEFYVFMIFSIYLKNYAKFLKNITFITVQ